MSDNQPPPHDPTAEMGILGAMLMSADVIADMTKKLRATDFYRPGNGTIFSTIVAMFSRGEPVDAITVLSTLIAAGDAERVGGAPYLATLREYANVASAGSYANAVARMATERALLAHAAQAAQLAGMTGDTDAKVAAIRESADNLGAHRETTAGAWVGDLVSPALTAMDEAGNPETNSGIIPTGFADLDRLFGGGIRPGQLVVIAGRPGLGKSTLGLDICRNASIRHGITGALVSLEMTEEEIMQRLLSAESRIPLAQIRTGDLRADEMTRVIDQVQPITDAPLRVIAQAQITLSQIRQEVLRLKQRHGLRFLVLDYLQLMEPAGPVESRQQFVASLSRGLNVLALQERIAVIIMSQLNRGPEQRQDKRPGLGDLRESGAIEQDVNIAILLHRPDADNPDSPRAGEVDLIVAKHRGGPTGTITVANRLHVAQFADLAIL